MKITEECYLFNKHDKLRHFQEFLMQQMNLNCFAEQVAMNYQGMLRYIKFLEYFGNTSSTCERTFRLSVCQSGNA